MTTTTRRVTPADRFRALDVERSLDLRSRERRAISEARYWDGFPGLP